MTIATQQAKVYYAPTAGRRFLTKAAAINKEARAIIRKHFPGEPPCKCTMERCGLCGDRGWSLEVNQPERFARYYRLLTAALRRSIR